MYKLPVVAVIGHKSSGKTTVVENLIRELKKKKYKVATAKHVEMKDFSLDTQGKNTWRHSAAGADPVICVSNIETAILMQHGEDNFSLDQMFRILPEVDVVILEGFSWLVLEDEQVGKIVCVRNKQEYIDYQEKSKGDTIAFCSFKRMDDQIFRIIEDSSTYVLRALKFIEKKFRINKINQSLPGLDCKKCLYDSCKELAVAIYQGKAKISDCVPLKLKNKLKTEIIINNVEISTQSFVSEFVRKTILGMISSLKGASIKGDERVLLRVSSET